MGIFDFLKIDKHSSRFASSLNSISDLFQFDLEEVDESKFEKMPINSSQTLGIQSHLERSLKPKERGLFDKLSIKRVSSNKFENYTFSNLNFKRCDVPKVKRLVNDIVSIIGIDSIHAGKFKSDDALDLKSDYWTGRSWVENEFNTPITLGFDSDSGLTLVLTKRIVVASIEVEHLG